MEFLRPMSAASSLNARCLSSVWRRSASPRCLLHNGRPRQAIPIAHPPFAGHPPSPPQVQAGQPEDRLARKRRNAELLQQGQEARADTAKPGTPLKKRFWKDVSVKTTDDGLQIMLDTRPVRAASKQVLTIPHDKRALATAIALEWDHLTSAQQALKQHYVPITSLASRALDLQAADAQGNTRIREDIVKMMMRYLSTDTLLCWAPEKNLHDPTGGSGTLEIQATQSLRARQIAMAEPIIGYLKTHIFPGVDIEPILDEESIMPKSQPQMTQEIIRGWLHGLPAFELAALERNVLASKSLLIAIRLLVEWSREFSSLQPRQKSEESNAERFGIVQAAHACTIEVTWQTDSWGEVEDTHDVDKEDLARQLGSSILLVS